MGEIRVYLSKICICRYSGLLYCFRKKVVFCHLLFGMTYGWVNDKQIWHFGWTISLKELDNTVKVIYAFIWMNSLLFFCSYNFFSHGLAWHRFSSGPVQNNCVNNMLCIYLCNHWFVGTTLPALHHMIRSVPLYWTSQRKVLHCLTLRVSQAPAPPLHSPADTMASLLLAWERPASWVRDKLLKWSLKSLNLHHNMPTEWQKDWMEQCLRLPVLYL